MEKEKLPSIRLKIKDRLIIPYGFTKKWLIDKFKIVGVDDKATYIESELPCFYLDKSSTPPLRIKDINSTTTSDLIDDDYFMDTVLKYLLDKCETEHERKFLKYYFGYINNRLEVFNYEALLPLPQAHVYFKDPLTEDEDTFVSEKSNRIDFLFWNGEKIILVEITGESPNHKNKDKTIADTHIIKDRKFQHAGIQIIHIMNKEVDKYGLQVIERLLPKEILDFTKLHG